MFTCLTLGASWLQVTDSATWPPPWQTGLAISYAVWATSRSFAAFLASRVIGGISKGNVSLSTAIVADLGSPPTRSQGMVSEQTQGTGIDGLQTPCLVQVVFSLGSYWGSLLPGLYSGSYARGIPVCGNGALDQPTLCSLRHVVHLLLLARDTTPGKTGRPRSREG